MQPTAVIAWGFSVGSSLRKSQAKTLADLVVATMQVGPISLAALGRHLAGPTLCKHKIKRAGRFCANRRITVAEGMRDLIERLGRRRREPLLVALDGVEVRSFHSLKAAAIFGGHALPLLWASYPE